jgi:hypothetical protein
MQVQAASKLPVDGFVVAPDVFLSLATAKASTGGQYLSGRPLSAAPIMTLWGLPLAVYKPKGFAPVTNIGAS